MANQEHPPEESEKDKVSLQRPTSWWQLMCQRFPRRQFVMGAVIPMMLFYTCKRLGQPLLGAFLAGGWGLSVVLAVYWRSRRIDLFAGIATTLAVIELATTAITRSPTFYLASAAIDSAILSVVFFSSLLWSRSLIQRVAEETVGLERFPEALRQSPSYRAAWRLLTAVWGGVYLCKAIVLGLVQWRLPLEAFLVVRTLAGWPVWALLFALSFWFPGWYWRQGWVRQKAQG